MTQRVNEIVAFSENKRNEAKELEFASTVGFFLPPHS